MSKKEVAANLDMLRNIGIIAHIDAGKTTLTERILFYTEKIYRMGEVHEGSATMDFIPEEQERGITISSACTTCLWNKHTINIIDTPGHVDFSVEVERSLRVLDGVIGVFCAVGGVEPQSETVWAQSEQYRIPKIAFVNKLDRPGADFDAVLESMRARLKVRPVPVLVPLGQGNDFEAVADLIEGVKIVFSKEDSGKTFTSTALTDSEKKMVADWKETMLETLSDYDDELMEAYLSGREVPGQKLKEVLRSCVLSRSAVPVFSGSALKNTGVQPLLDAVCTYLPSPADVDPPQGVGSDGELVIVNSDRRADLTALCFKVSMETGRKLAFVRIYSGQLKAGDEVFNATQGKKERAARIFIVHAARKEKIESAGPGQIVAVAGLKDVKTADTLSVVQRPVILEKISEYRPVISLGLEPKNSVEQEKLEKALNRLIQEDPTLCVERSEETDQLVISGMGELHLEVTLERLRREWNVDFRAGKPQVVYQETIRSTAEQWGEFNRELGDELHWGRVLTEVFPQKRGVGNEIVIAKSFEDIPKGLLDAVRSGLEDGLQTGVVNGYPLQDVRIVVKEIDVSGAVVTPVGCRMAAMNSLKASLKLADPTVLEPIMKIEIVVPEDFVGECISLLGSKGAKVENLSEHGGARLIAGRSSLRDLFGFSTELRSATQGRAGMSMKFDSFDVLD